MPSGIGRLPFIKRRGAIADRMPSDAPAIDAEAVFEDAPVGPPVLLPAMIYRQVLVDPTEVTPVWARPRPPVEPEPAVGTDEPAEQQPARRRKGTATPGAPKANARPRSPRKPSSHRRRG